MQADPRGVGVQWVEEGALVYGGDINNPEPGLSLGLALGLGHQAVTGCSGPVYWERNIQFMSP